MQTGTRVIAEQKIGDYISKLASQTLQTSIASEILKDEELQSDAIQIDACFIFEKHHLLQILTIFKTVVSIDIQRALVVLLYVIIRAEGGLRTARVEALQSSGIIDQVIDLALPLMAAKKAKGQDLVITCLRFFESALSAGLFCARKFVGNGTTPIFTTLNEIIRLQDDSSLDVIFECAKCSLSISQHPSLCFFMTKEYAIYANLLADTFDNEMGGDKETVGNLRVIMLNVVYNLIKHSSRTIENIVSDDVLSSISRTLKLSSTLNAQLTTLRLYRLLLTKEDHGQHKKLEPLLGTIFKMAQNPDTAIEIRISTLKCLSTAMIHMNSKTIQRLLSDFQWLLQLCKESSSAQIISLAMELLHSISGIDLTLSTKKSGSMLLQYALQIINSNQHKDDRMLYHAVGIICNLAFNDKMAQRICHTGNRQLISKLFEYSQSLNADIQKVSLECIRNLCIDKIACLDVLEIGLPLLLINLGQFRCITPSLQILRNIYMQQYKCALELLNQPRFVDLLLLMTRQQDEAQKSGLDIINQIIESKNEKYVAILLERGVLGTLQSALRSSKNKQQAAQIIDKIKQFQTKDITLQDPWDRIKLDWKRIDKQQGRETIRKTANLLTNKARRRQP